MKKSALLLLLYSFTLWALPDGFVDISFIEPDIIVEARYHGAHNFMGRPVDGYVAPKCLLTVQAAEALALAHKSAKERGYALKVYDCYRPQMAVDHFVRWAKDLEDKKMKGEFYPEVDKQDLFKQGYIAAKSGHSRGSTVDLTLVKLPAASQPVFDPQAPLVDCRSPKRFADNSVEMGTGYDCFDPLSHTENPRAGESALNNRRLLKIIMEEAGFKNYKKEWWHYTLKSEPHPNVYFTFPIE